MRAHTGVARLSVLADSIDATWPVICLAFVNVCIMENMSTKQNVNADTSKEQKQNDKQRQRSTKVKGSDKPKLQVVIM